jgi:hypothetical protein
MVLKTMMKPWLALPRPHDRRHASGWGWVLGGIAATLWGAGILPGFGETPVAQSFEAQLTVTVEHSRGDTYTSLVQRAESVGRAAVQRNFDNDILATDVLVFVNVRKGGLEAPILVVEASRSQWSGLPDVRRWATYFPGTRKLLGLDELPPPVPTTTTPLAVPATVPGAVPEAQTPGEGIVVPGGSGIPAIAPLVPPPTIF